jgi:hypothetical protein
MAGNEIELCVDRLNAKYDHRSLIHGRKRD